MSCEKNTNGQGLRYPSKFRAVPNLREELFVLGWEIVGSEVNRLQNLGWAADKKGKRAEANHYYKGANQYFYLVELAQIARRYVVDIGRIDEKCNSKEVYEKYNLDCLDESLPCLGKEHGTNYLKAWRNLLEVYNIDTSTTNCEVECCVGIGQMVVEGPEDCDGFIINECNV